MIDGVFAQTVGDRELERDRFTLAKGLVEAAELDGLQVVSGSHQFGRVPDAEHEEIRAGKPIVLCSVDPGDAFLMRPLLLHSSSKPSRAGRRRVAHIEYSCHDFPGDLQWHWRL